jgi:phage terminase small subunit
MSNELIKLDQDVKLKGKQLIFAEAFLKLKFNGSAAIKEAGYYTKNPGFAANQLLNNPNVLAYIEKRKEQLLSEIGVNQFRVLKELAAIAFADIRDYYINGKLKNPTDLDENAAAAIMCIDVFELRDTEGILIGETKRVRMQDKIKALELLGRYLNLFEKDNESRKPELNVYEVTLNLK